MIIEGPSLPLLSHEWSVSMSERKPRQKKNIRPDKSLLATSLENLPFELIFTYAKLLFL